jgi:GIY-YIG catalytic domain
MTVSLFIVIPGEDRAQSVRSEGRESMGRRYFVYIMANKRNGTLYVGVTGDLANRTWQHKSDLIDGFTKKYGRAPSGLVRGVGRHRRRD